MFGMSVCLEETPDTRARGAWMVSHLDADEHWLDADDPAHACVRQTYMGSQLSAPPPRSADAGPMFDATPYAYGTFVVSGARAFVLGPRAFLRWCCVLCAGICPILIPPRMCAYVTLAVRDQAEELLDVFERLCFDLSDPRFMHGIVRALRRPSDVEIPKSSVCSIRSNATVALFIATVPYECRIGLADMWVRFHSACPQDPLFAADESIRSSRAKEIIDKCFLHIFL